MPYEDPNIDDMRYALSADESRPATMNPLIAAQGRKARANMAPPESVMDPRYAAWKKNQEDAELFGIASDIALNAVPFAGPAFNVARKAAAPLARAAGETLNARMLSGQSLIPGLPPSVAPNPLAFVVKPKGGNWLTGDVEGSMTRLKNMSVPDYDNYSAANVTDEAKAQANALRSWVDTKLTRYLKNELATPEDPVRALAERNISHLQNEYEGVSTPSPTIMDRRIAAGQNWRGAGTSPLAKQWDYRADLVVDPTDARSLSSLERDQLFGNKRVPPETVVHQIGASPIPELELGHLVDELRNALDPTSGLPRNLQLTPEQLSKVTMPQAVERVAKINAWRAAQKAEADAARASNAATVTHREYPTIPGTDAPNERGLRWVELKNNPEAPLPEGWSKHVDDRTGRLFYMDVSGRKMPDTPYLQDALQYEGDAMGHCVGGYCPDVSTGRKRIYSLRDAKGQPHVTIEVQPGPRIFDTGTPEGRPGPETIKQIKGKGNRKPNDEYLPFVQDFVRSGQWSDVGDLKNADMFKLPDDRFVTRQRFEEAIGKLGGAGGKPIEPEWLSEQIRRDPSWWENVKPAFEEPAPVRQHKMLQGIYRGYAGENDVNNALTGNYVAYGTPQRRVAEHYAQTRSAATGQPPHMEMLMVDPFDVKRSYGHAPAVRADQEPMVTQAKQLLPTQIKGRTQLYKKGGAVTLDDMRYALTMRK